MKILEIDAYHHVLGGAEKVMFNTSELLKEHGHEVIYFALQWHDNLESEYSPYFASSKESRNGILSPLKNIFSYFYHRDAAKKIELLIEKEHPDLAQIHLIWGNVTPSILPVLKKHHIPIVLTVHDYRLVCPGYLFENGKSEVCEQCEGHKFWKCVTNKCCKDSYLLSSLMAGEIYFRNKILHAVDYIDGFIFVSNFSRKKHESYMTLLKDKKSTVLYNFSDSICDEPNVPVTPRYFLYYGRLSHEKGVHTLVRTVAALNRICLKIVGTGPEEESLKQSVVERGHTNVEFLGYKQGDELNKLVKEAYFVIVPSECYENNPMTIVEAYSASTPVIGSRIGGIPEIIKEGETGFCFEYGQVKSLEETIKKADALNEYTYMEMRKQALRFAHQHFNKERYYQMLIQFYQDLMQK